MKVTHDVKIQIDDATGTQTDTAVAAAIKTAVEGLSGYDSPAIVTVKSTAGSAMQDVAHTKINPTYPTE